MTLIIEGEDTLFRESINTPEEFIEDMCERFDNMYSIAMHEEDRMVQLKCIMGFLRAFKGRLNRVCEKPFKIFDFEIMCQKYRQKDVSELILDGEESYLGELIKTPEKFIEDLCNIVDVVYASAMEEEQEMNRLAYLIGAILGIKSKLDRVCGKI